MKKLIYSLCFIVVSLNICVSANAQTMSNQNPLLSNAKQLIVVVTKDWGSKQGYLYSFDRKQLNDKWSRSSISSPVVIGKNGMGWGSGFENLDGPKKIEGDYRSPAGTYSLTKTFGFAKISLFSIDMPYYKINDQTVCVDDSSSRYYGEIINITPHVFKDWKSAEQMNQYKGYKWGVFVNYNIYQRKFNSGSCIFLHAWENFTTTTAGCTAMPEKIIREIVFWLNKKSNPILVQMPLKVYVAFAHENGLPKLD